MRALRAAMIVWLLALLALFAFPSLPAPSYAAPDQCGVWRWGVKTLSRPFFVQGFEQFN